MLNLFLPFKTLVSFTRNKLIPFTSVLGCVSSLNKNHVNNCNPQRVRLYSSNGTLPPAHVKFNANHQRKFIISAFNLSYKEKPSVFVSLCGLPDNVDLSLILNNNFYGIWKSLILISKHENTVGDLKFGDLLEKSDKNLNFYNLSLDELVDSIKNKNNSSYDIKTILSDSLFIFEGYNWFEIANYFKVNDIEITGGIGTKRHIISPTQFKLFYSLPILKIEYSLISSYYLYGTYLLSSFKNNGVYNSNSSFLNSNLPNGSSSREYSTLRCLNNFGCFNKVGEILNTPIGSNIPVDNDIPVDKDIRVGNKKILGDRLRSSNFGSNNLRNTNNILLLNKERSRFYSKKAKKGDIVMNKQSLYFSYSPLYLNLSTILYDGDLSAFEKQRKMEKLLNNAWYDIYMKELHSINPHTNEYNFGFKTHILEFRESLNNFLLSLDKKTSEKKYLRPILNLSLDEICIITYKILIPLLYSLEQHSKTKIVIKIGKAIFKKWVKLEYINSQNNGVIQDFDSFKDSLNFSDKEFLIAGDLILSLIINKSDIFNIVVDNSDSLDTKIFIEPNEKVKNLHSKCIEILGFKLPMVSPPIKWDKDISGGYILNNEEYREPLIIPSKKSRGKTIIDNNEIYHAVNYISEIPFVINKHVYGYILAYNEFLGILNSLHPKTEEYQKSPFALKKKILSHNSLYYLQKNILSLSRLYINVSEFYFAIKLDWRGRLYCDSSYLNFQGNEISKALLKFKNGAKLNEKALFYLKIYGANCYGVNKLSFSERAKWIESNSERIRQMDINFIRNASQPLLFIAFCFEYNGYMKDPENFISTLPISLDASCNGFQHLSAMVGESSIAKNVNLFESNIDTPPMDFYNFCLDLINEKLKELVKKEPNFIKLSKLNLTRSIIKHSIMTIPYNVSKIGIADQLKDHFEWVKIDNENFLKPIWHPRFSDFVITQKELYRLAVIIHNTLYENHPKLKALVNYLEEIARIFHKLQLNLEWYTPSGLIINQTYTQLKSIRIKTALSGKNSNYTIKIPTESTDLSKQKAGLMPNIVHSLDAANIIIMINYLISNEKPNKRINLFTVHDCFATTADSIDLISGVVRYAFLMLYSDNNYIKNLHNYYLDIIKATYTVEDDSVLTENDEKIIIPSPPLIEDLDLRNKLKDAIYFIH